MKLLGWMNRKLRQDSIEPWKTFSTGNSCACLPVQPWFGKQQCHLEHGFTSAHSKQTERECSKYSACLTAIKGEEVKDEEADFFHGFLTVGTLGSGSRVADPATPKFALSYQNGNEKEAEVTGTELKLMNNKLERFLEAESADDVDYDSSRSSFVSTITLSNYQIEEGNDVEEIKNMAIFPLQEYLLHSSTECLQTGEEMKRGKGSIEEQKEEETPYKGKGALKFMKKILKKILVSSRSSKDSANDQATCTVSIKSRFPKALQLLNKKYHPERSIAKKKMSKSPNDKGKTKHQDTGVTILEKDDHKLPEMIILKEKVTTMNLKNDSLHRSHSTGFGEYWIKTDADYLVLEL